MNIDRRQWFVVNKGIGGSEGHHLGIILRLSKERSD